MTHKDGQVFLLQKLSLVEVIKDKAKNLFKGISATTAKQLKEGQGHGID